MKIKKTFQGELPENRVVNAKSNSATDAYSANYLNDKLRNVVVSPTEPSTGEDVWIKRSSNILKFDNFEKTVNGITFTMKDQVLHVEGTATAYTQECYLPINLTLEEAMTLTVDWNDDNLVPKAAYTYNGTSYYPNIYSQELEPGTYLNQLYFIIASGATVNTDVRFQLEKGRGFSGWQPVMEKAILVKNDNDVYEDFIKRNIHVGTDTPKNGEDVWIKRSKNLFNINGDVCISGGDGNHYADYNIVENGVLIARQNSALAHGAGQKIGGLKGKTFTVSATVTSVGSGWCGLLSIYDNNTEIKKITIEAGDRKSIVYTANSDNIIIAFATGTGTDAKFEDIMVEIGGVPTKYEPYLLDEILTKNGDGSYSSLDNANIYSTEEQRIGIWIDGKPLYRKVMYSSARVEAGASYMPNTAIPNVEVVTDVDVTIGAFGYASFKNHWSNDGGDMFISTQFDKNSGLYISADYTGFIGWILKVEYTKTTD